MYRGYDEAVLHTIPDSAAKDFSNGDLDADGMNSSRFSNPYRRRSSIPANGKRAVSITSDDDIHEEVTDLILIVHGIGQGVCPPSRLKLESF